MALQVLRKPWQFRQVYRAGKKIDCRYAVLFYYRPGEATGTQFGFVASKRVGNAVKRSRAKRLLREAAGRTAPRLLRNDLWIVLVARSGILDIKCQDLEAALLSGLAAEGLI
jgi:ribonuclease P protein component